MNEAGVQHADGDGYYIRDGIIIVPKDGVIEARNQGLKLELQLFSTLLQLPAPFVNTH